MEECSKAAKRRKLDWRYTNRFFVGRGLDVGCGNDAMKKEDWPLVTEVVPYDKEFGNIDGQYLPEIKDGEFDFVHSSHCLEHLNNTRASLTNWLRVLRPGGFIICTIPDELLYECGHFPPSRFNPDHKVSLTLRSMPVVPTSLNLVSLLWKMPVDVEIIQLLTEHWDKAKLGQDQTLGPAECAIELVLRKPTGPNVIPF
jgi:SAM-dependent methyltransferase